MDFSYFLQFVFLLVLRLLLLSSALLLDRDSSLYINSRESPGFAHACNLQTRRDKLVVCSCAAFHSWREAMQQSAFIGASCVWACGLPVASSAAGICPTVYFVGVWLWAGARSRWAISCLCLCPKKWAIPLRNSPLSTHMVHVDPLHVTNPSLNKTHNPGSLSWDS